MPLDLAPLDRVLWEDWRGSLGLQLGPHLRPGQSLQPDGRLVGATGHREREVCAYLPGGVVRSPLSSRVDSLLELLGGEGSWWRGRLQGLGAGLEPHLVVRALSPRSGSAREVLEGAAGPGGSPR